MEAPYEDCEVCDDRCHSTNHRTKNLGIHTNGRQYRLRHHGHATALQFAVAGYPVKLVDCSEELLKRGIERIRADAEEFAQAGLLRAEDTVDDVLSRISTYTDYENGVSDADFIIESIVEKLDVKQSVWQQIEQYAPVDAIFATNTSGFWARRNPICAEAPGTLCDGSFLESWASDAASRVVPGKDTAPEVLIRLRFDGKHRQKACENQRNLWDSWATVCNWRCCARRSTSSMKASPMRKPSTLWFVTVWDDAGISSAPWPAPIWADWTRSTTSAPTCSKTWITAPNRAICWLGKCRMGTLAQKPAVVLRMARRRRTTHIRERDEQLMQQLAEDAAVEDAD